MHAVFLVGTDHRYQRGAALGVSDEVFVEFRAELQRLVARHGIQGIAEEMSLDGMGMHRSAGGSLGFHLAGERRFPHLYCDPSRRQRQELGITSLEQRECYWLEQLRAFSGFPCLFILGAEHVSSFSALLRRSGFEVVVLIQDWEPKVPTKV